MVKKIFYSFQSNILIAVLNMLITILTAKYLGAAGRGELTLIITYIAFVQIINEIIGTSSIHYILKKFRVSEVVFISIVWFFLISLTGTLLLILINSLNRDLGLMIFFAIFLFALNNLMFKIILNKVSLKWYNIIIILQPLLIIILIYLLDYRKLSIYNYLSYQLFSYFLLLVLSFFLLKSHFEKIRKDRIGQLIRESFRLGATNQAANFSQILNYRLAYLFLEKFWGLSTVGVFSIVLAVVNVIWLFSSTIATLLNNEVTKISISEDRIKLTNRGVFLTFIMTLGVLFVFFVIPTNFYTYILNKDFADLKKLIFIMSPAILIFSLTRIISHYFSGIGLVKYNFLSSLIGLVSTLILSPLLIKELELVGAAISNSLSYITSAGVIFFFFVKKRYHLNK